MAAPPACRTTCPLATLGNPPPMSQTTTFPSTSTSSKESGKQKPELRFPFAPGYTSGNSVGEKSWGWNKDSPVYSAPFPSTADAAIFLSIVLAPTVRIHGASLERVAYSGPEFAAEQLTKTPF
ncbi:hypothetical protein V8G54_015606 [Vigna mungo]|uniref:Uncharacterized protein n=1 Tax=Vigna mungo TaxID=3915 RepID=A0AAQ3NLK0_VIGMU